MIAPQRLMTEDEYVAWCEAHDEVRSEYVDGRVIILAADFTPHEEARVFLQTLLRHFLRIKGLGRVFGPNLETRLRPGLRRLPDVTVVGPGQSGELDEERVEGAPLLTFEIVGKHSFRRDYHDKRRDYEAAGVPEYWIVDPKRRRVTVFSRDERGGYREVPAIDGIHTSRVLPGFRIVDEWLWQNPTPSEIEILRDWGLI